MNRTHLVTIGVALAAIGNLDPIASLQEPAGLKSMARERGGKYETMVVVDLPAASLQEVVSDASLIVQAHIASVVSKLSSDQQSVQTHVTFRPHRIFKDRLRLGSVAKPGMTVPYTFVMGGGTVREDGLEITYNTTVSIEPALQVGEEIIAFIVEDPDAHVLRLSFGPYGIFRISGNSVSSGNRMVRKVRPLPDNSVTYVLGEIERLLRQGKGL